MSKLAAQVQAALPAGVTLPAPLVKLFEWIESEKLFVDRPTGERVGYLFPQEELRANWTKSQRPGGTLIEFSAQGNTFLKYWFGHERMDVLQRLCVFARTGSDGSMAALWLDPTGGLKIVHLGSGSGSLMVCILAHDANDFLRLLAIGYDEICWGEQFEAPPNHDRSMPIVLPNLRFRKWVEAELGLSIPRTAAEIVAHPDDMGAWNSDDAFNCWVEANVA